MASIDDGELFLEIPGASREELEAGLAAARRVFMLWNVKPTDAFDAEFKTGDMDALVTDEEAHLAEVAENAWDAAERAVERVRGTAPEDVELSAAQPNGAALAGDEPHYKFTEFDTLPQLPLGLPSIDARLLDRRLVAVH